MKQEIPVAHSSSPATESSTFMFFCDMGSADVEHNSEQFIAQRTTIETYTSRKCKGNCFHVIERFYYQ